MLGAGLTDNKCQNLAKHKHHCYEHGRYSAVQGKCIAKTDADCKDSADCKWRDMCSAVGGVCVIFERATLK